MKRTLVSVAISVVLLLGAGRALSTDFLSPGNPLILKPAFASKHKIFRSLASFTIAIRDQHWLVTDINLGEGFIVADIPNIKSRQGSPFDFSIIGRVDEKGTISVTAHDGQELPVEYHRNLVKWMNNLKRSFAKFSIYPTDQLEIQLRKTVYWETLNALLKE